MIRVATLADVPQLVELGKRVHAESPRYSRLSYSEARVADALEGLITNVDGLALVHEHEGRIAGYVLAFIQPEWFSDTLTANELVLYVVPELRGTTIGPALIGGLVAWAAQRGVPYVQAGVASGILTEQTAKLYEHVGFSRCGILLEREFR